MSSEVEIRAPAEQTEGTRSQILRWLKSVGDTVTENEPLIELETDKVTVEVASPGSGTLREILKQEQEEIGPGDLLGRIEAAGTTLAAGAVHRSAQDVGSAPATAEGQGPASGIADGQDGVDNGPHAARGRNAEDGGSRAAKGTDVAGGYSPRTGQGSQTADGVAAEAARSRPMASGGSFQAAATAQAAGTAARDLSPAVRRLLAERGLDASEVHGTGQGGRVTVADVIGHGTIKVSPGTAAPGTATHANGSSPNAVSLGALGTNASGSNAGNSGAAGTNAGAAVTSDATGPGSAGPSHRVPHTATRKRIAEHMVQSLLHTAPHVTTVFEADLTAVLEHRQRNKEDFARRGAPLTLTAYFLQATVAAIRAVPEANSRWTDSALEIFDFMHIGVATALETGLVVPVLRDVQARDLFEMAKGLEDLVSRAREGRLATTDVRGGTFTISNHGVSGSLVATPIIINQPQAAILGIGKLEKRPVVSSDADGGEDRIVIRPRCYVTLTIDHRVMDGHQANRFLQTFVGRLATSPG
jgi:2-oxoglutarate dehydrogenase E2 component (dihydrolipoamide succinyltransferase)